MKSLYVPPTAKEVLDKVELALAEKNYIDANHWMVDFWCLRLNNWYPLSDLDERFRRLGERFEKELDLNQFLDEAETYLNKSDYAGAKETLLTYAELCRQGAAPGDKQRYNKISERLVVEV